MRRVTLLLVLPCLGAADSCDPPKKNPSVEAFDVQPRSVCPGDTVTVTWKTQEGTPMMYSKATVDLAQALALEDWSQLELPSASGSQAVVVTENTTFKVASVDVPNANVVAYPTDIAVTVVSGASWKPLEFPACAGGTWGTAPGASSTSPSVQVIQVENQMDRAVSLSHAGQSFTVGPLTSDPAPPSLPWPGPWSASMPLLDGEGCPGGDWVQQEGPPPETEPPTIAVRAAVACP